MKIALLILNGSLQGSVIDVPEKSCFVLGRGKDADLKLSNEDVYMSLRHALLDTTVSCRLIDLGSSNPAHVNGLPVRESILKDGDVVELGYTKIRISISSEPHCFICNAELEPAKKDPCTRDSASSESVYACVQHAPFDSAFAGKTFRRYQVCRLVGEGGMGAVYLVYDPQIHRLLALKCLKDLKNRDLVRRFHLETLELKEFQHKNILRFVDSDIDDSGAPFLVTEYVPDGDLAQYVRQTNGSIERDPAVAIAAAVLEGLEYIHSKGDVHRDIKPQNILLRKFPSDTRNFIPKIADLGLVKNFLRAGGSRITKPGEASGSLAFMPPEQVTHFSELQPTADIYSAGATLYYALTGQYVIDFPAGATETQELECAMNGRRISIRDRSRDISPDLAAVVDRACASDPARRFQTAAEFRADLLRAKN